MENQFEINSQPHREDTSNIIENDLTDRRKEVSTFRRILPQIIAGSIKNLLLFDLGVVLGFQTIIIGNLLNATSWPSFTEDESSWFASLLFITQPIGSLLSALVLEPIGRKKSMIILNLPLFIGWFAISVAQSVPMLYAGSIFLGAGLGFLEAPTITYIGEISEPSIRGIMTSYAELVVGVGTLVVYMLGVFFDWRTVAYICTAIPAISAVAVGFIPESPIWLLAHNRDEQAEKALCWLRGWVTPESVQEEYSQLVLYRNSKIMSNITTQSESNNDYSNEIDITDENIRNETFGRPSLVKESGEDCKENEDIGSFRQNNPLQTTVGKENNLNNIISNLLEPNMFHALMLMIGFFFFNAAAGANVVQAYTIPVFQELGFTVEPFKANVVTAVALTLGQLTLTILVFYLGKRKMVLFSILGCAVSCFAIGVYGLQPNSGSTESFWSMPFIIYTANNYVYGLGLSSIPWMYLSELFPFRGRSAATGLTASINYIFGFFVTKTFFTIKSALTLAGLFFFYGVVSLVGLAYLYFLLPETEGRTLQDIEDNGRRKKNNT